MSAEPARVSETASQQRHFQGVVSEHLETLTQNLLEAAGATQTKWIGYCTHCRKKVEIEVPDVRARTDAIRMLHELGYGKPKAEVDSGGIILRRTIVVPEGVESSP